MVVGKRVIAKFDYLGATSTIVVAAYGVARENAARATYADASRLPLSPEFEKDFEACAGKGKGKGKEVWMRQLRIRPGVHFLEHEILSNDARSIRARQRVGAGGIIQKSNTYMK